MFRSESKMLTHQNLKNKRNEIDKDVNITNALEKYICEQKTGSHELDEKYKIKTCLFDLYQVKVVLTSDNKFIGIKEVKLNKDFISYKEKINKLVYSDVDEYYQD